MQKIVKCSVKHIIEQKEIDSTMKKYKRCFLSLPFSPSPFVAFGRGGEGGDMNHI